MKKNSILKKGLAVVLTISLAMSFPYYSNAAGNNATGSTKSVDIVKADNISVSSTVTSSLPIATQTQNDSYAVRDSFYSLTDSTVNRATSEHFQIIWGNSDTTRTVNYDFVVGNLVNLENIRAFYINELGMKDIGVSRNSRIKGNYKTNVYISGTGLSKFEDDWAYMAVDSQDFAFLFVAPGAMRVDEPSWVIPHELAHAFTYHQGGSVAYAWYESTANWFRDQYLGSQYYAYGNKTYGPTSDFFAPYMINSSYYVPHMLNWYDTWPIFLYISENPDNIDGLGMELMHKILEYNGSNESMYDIIEKLSGVSIKTILGGMSRRLATMDFARQTYYLERLNKETLTVKGNYEKIYTTLNAKDSEGWQSVPSDRAPMQTGFNIIPLDVDLSKDVLSVEIKSTSAVSGADFRTSIVTSTASNYTRYSNTVEGDGVATIKLNKDETKAYLVVCATPDKIEEFQVDWNSSAEDESTRFGYKVKITTSVSKAEDTIEFKSVNGQWGYYKNGEIDTSFTGLYKHNGNWFYIQNGLLTWGYTGMVKHNGHWFYVKGSQLDWSFTGLYKYPVNGTWFYFTGGQLDWGYTGIASNANGSYYVAGGIIDWSYTGVYKQGRKIYDIVEGKATLRA